MFHRTSGVVVQREFAVKSVCKQAEAPRRSSVNRLVNRLEANGGVVVSKECTVSKKPVRIPEDFLLVYVGL
jgi:hypothetical protein